MTGEILPFALESWAGQPGCTSITDIQTLALNGVMQYIGQGQVFEFAEDKAKAVGSDGFGACSGLIVRDEGAERYIISHLEPFADAFYEWMRTGLADQVQWLTLHEAVIIYGSVSARQVELERLMVRQFWGPTKLRIVQVETGDTHWGMVFEASLGHLAIVRKLPDQSVVKYQIFEPRSNT